VKHSTIKLINVCIPGADAGFARGAYHGEREPIMGVYTQSRDGAPTKAQRQSPWSLKLKVFCPFSYKTGAKS